MAPGADPCADCDRAVRTGLNRPEEIRCPDCKFIIPLWPENAAAMDFIERLGPGLMGGGTVNAGLIRLGFETMSVPREKRADLLEKINAYASEVFAHWEREASGN